MIISKLNGGLGNQLFQYALGRHLAEIHATSLKIDISTFCNDRKRKYALYPFNTKQTFISIPKIKILGDKKKRGLLYGIENFARIFSKRTYSHVRESNLFQFDPAILQKSNNVYLEGSWQNERYFKEIEQIIRKEFVLKESLIGVNKVIEKSISSCESVSLHIRRGDYASDAETRSFHGLCGLQYYYHAVKLLVQKVSDPYFFIFSDDPDWVRSNLDLQYPSTVVYNGENGAHVDMHLMSICKYHIIANSSFSWWGAWLGNYANKIVIYPPKWLKSDLHDTSDLFPEDWVCSLNKGNER